MQVHTLECRQTVPGSRTEIFAFFERPENLEQLTPRRLRFRFLTPGPIVMKEGALIDYALRVRGFPIHWRTLITCYEPPVRFIDEQLRGPYTFWHHTHLFHETADGTEIEDRVRYVLPLGRAGGLFHPLVRHELESVFRYRRTVIERLLGIATRRSAPLRTDSTPGRGAA